MAHYLRHVDVWVQTLTEDARRTLIDRLAAVDAEVFERESPTMFRLYFDPRPGGEVAVRIFTRSDGEIVGFSLVRVAEVRVRGERWRVLRSTAAVRREFRGQAVTGFSVRMAFRERLKHPFARVMMFEQMTHPWSYSQVSRFVRTIYPRYDRSTPARVRRVIAALADEFGLAREDAAANPYVCLFGARTRQTDEEHHRWSESNNPDVRFYHRINPRYAEGRALLALIPVTWTDTVVSVSQYLWLRWSHALRRMRALLPRRRVRPPPATAG